MSTPEINYTQHPNDNAVEFTLSKANERTKTCSCVDIIYNDVKKYMMEIPQYKEVIEKLESDLYNELNYIHYATISAYIIGEYESFNYMDNQYDLYSQEMYEEIQLTEYWSKSDEEKKQTKYWNKLIILGKIPDEYMLYYAPSLRNWFYESCKNPVLFYDKSTEWVQRSYFYDDYPEVDYKEWIESCETPKTARKFIQSAFVTLLFEHICNPIFKPYRKEWFKKRPETINVLKDRLNSFKNHEVPFCNEWKGSDYYFKQLFNISIYLDKLNIPEEIIKFRYDSNFEAMIYGHPKASNGLCMDGLYSLERLGCIN